MPNRQAERVAVVGAAGFVGRALLRTLQDAGTRCTAVVRGASELAVDGSFHECLSPAAAIAGPGFETVINLAYPNGGPPYSYPAQNQAILHSVRSLVADGGRIIQVSTQAVFGLALDRAIHAGPVTPVRDHPYVEAKVEAELALSSEQARRDLTLEIVRLGNVWGPGSGAWTLPLVQRLITGRPVAVRGETGYSNTTDVRNVASYLATLTDLEDRPRETRYHHLAEFSSVRWMEWIEPLAAALSVDPESADPAVVAIPSSGSAELAGVLPGPRTIYRGLAAERVSGSLARSALRRLPQRVFDKVKGIELVAATPSPLGREEQTFLAIMSSDREFATSLHADWRPPVGQAQSLESVLSWLEKN